MKFAVMTDLHTDIIHDAEVRLDSFVSACLQNKVDFAVQLGDFIQPPGPYRYTCNKDRVTMYMKNILNGRGLSKQEKSRLFDKLTKAGIDVYHVLGNHDLDFHSKDDVVKYLGMPGGYYSFDRCGYHFVVLDVNYMCKDGVVTDFEYGNYQNYMFMPDEPFPYVPEAELNWLKDDLDKALYPTIVFSHEGVNEGFLNALNYKEIFDIFENAPNKVILCMNGHKHEDMHTLERNIPVYSLNSISGYSVPPAFEARRFDDAIEDKYPNVKYMCVYKEPLYCLVTIDESYIDITGRDGSFVKPTPDELNVHFDEGDIVIVPTASSVRFKR